MTWILSYYVNISFVAIFMFISINYCKLRNCMMNDYNIVARNFNINWFLCFFTLQGGDGGRTIEIKEGSSIDVKIEVTAEDGRTTKNYVIRVSRLSAKDASLSGLSIPSALEPEFNPKTFEYSSKILLWFSLMHV